MGLQFLSFLTRMSCKEGLLPLNSFTPLHSYLTIRNRDAFLNKSVSYMDNTLARRFLRLHLDIIFIFIWAFTIQIVIGHSKVVAFPNGILLLSFKNIEMRKLFSFLVGHDSLENLSSFSKDGQLDLMHPMRKSTRSLFGRGS